MNRLALLVPLVLVAGCAGSKHVDSSADKAAACHTVVTAAAGALSGVFDTSSNAAAGRQFSELATTVHNAVSGLTSDDPVREDGETLAGLYSSTARTVAVQGVSPSTISPSINRVGRKFDADCHL